MNLKTSTFAAIAIAGSVALAALPAYARDGGRHHGGSHHGGFHHGGFYRGGAAIAGLAAGALIGGAIANSYYRGPAYYGGGPYAYEGPVYGGPQLYAQAPGGADASCAARFRSYDPASGTYLGYDGVRHPCP